MSLKNSDSLVLILAILLTVFVDLLVARKGMVLSSFSLCNEWVKDEQSKQGNIADMEKKLKFLSPLKIESLNMNDGPLSTVFLINLKDKLNQWW